jgi:hypothetical protein
MAASSVEHQQDAMALLEAACGDEADGPADVSDRR